MPANVAQLTRICRTGVRQVAQRRRQTARRTAFGLLGCGLVLSAPAPTGAARSRQIVEVVAGKPFEFAFQLSSSVVSPGLVVFEVRNGGRLAHRFELCSLPGTLSLNACAGVGTKLIKPTARSSLRVFFKNAGRYEYLCGVRGHAAAGMKGFLTVR